MAGKSIRRQELGSTIFFVAALVGVLWSVDEIDRRLVALVSGLLVLLSLFAMPTWCCATRVDGGSCRNNTYGIFRGCRRWTEHRQQKLDAIRTKAYWIGLARGRYSGIRGALALYLAIAATLSGLAALIVA